MSLRRRMFFPSENYHSFIRFQLCDRILKEVRRFRVFKEADLQCVVYRCLMEWMEKNYPPDASLPRFLLNQPPISKSSRSVSLPDIVMFHGYDPIVAIELKLELNAIRERDFFNDVEKIERLRDRHPKLKNAYLIFVYDHDEELEIDEVENWMLRFFFPIGINVRRTENGKLRRGYREWRDLWDRLYSNLSA